ncbi:hypothetical protein L6452_34710 [Arctium lappa]|uniref:Uncharacterized protein n=1 Tax=Arctium lappa TaxID=4217 RepID=A0ACB8YK34_ARCLA|nr:hypothetical protein L6452_34710 [Arctium lappa]
MAASSSSLKNDSSQNFNVVSYDNGSIAKPPRFNPNNFFLWKSRMILFLEGVDSRYPTILHEGPFMPRVWDRYNADKGKADEDSSEEERTPAAGRYILKDPSKYNDEDRRLIALDTKVRAIIALSLPDEVYHSLVNLSTAKEMWSTLCVLYEGTSEVKKSKKIALVRKYELFSHEKGESLSDYYNRFNSLLNDLKLVGRIYDNEEVLCKFMDCLPEFWENICTCIKSTKDLDSMPLTALYGTLFNYEQSKLLRKSFTKDIKGSSLALVGESSKSTVCVPRITYPSDSDNDSQEDPNDPSEAYLSEADDEGEETSVAQLSDGVTMLAGFSKSKPHFPSRKPRFSRKPSSTFSKNVSSDKSNEECYRCGRKGHFASECRSRSSDKSRLPSSNRTSSRFVRTKSDSLQPSFQKSKTSAPSNSDRAEKYKAKYKREKERNALLANKGKGLLAESHDWADEPTSESDKEMANLCFMAKIDDADDGETSSTSMALVSAECSTSSTQVHPFFSLSDAEKIEAFDSLTIDFYEAKDAKKKANAQIKSLSSQLQICLSQLKHFDKIKAELDDLKTINFTLAKEKNKLLKKFKKEQETVKKWTSSSKNLERIFQDQISCDGKSGLGFGKYDLEPPSDTHAPFSLPSFYESSEENYDNSEPLDSSDPSKDLKFGMFIKAKSIDSPNESEETQDSNDPSKPIIESMCSLKINESSSSGPKPSFPKPSSNKIPFSKKGKSVANLPPQKKLPKKNSKKPSSLPIPRAVMLNKLNSKTPSSIPSTDSGKGILGPKPLDFPLPPKAMKVNVTSHHKESGQSSKKVFTYRKCYNCGNTSHLAKNCPLERIDKNASKDTSSPSNSKGPISKWVPKN